MKAFQIRPLNEEDSPWVKNLLEEWWAGTKIVTRGRVHQADELPGFIAVQDGKPVGLVTYHINGLECQIVSLNSLYEGIGIGTALIDAVKNIALAARCQRLWLITTNDNTAAIRFFQKRGFRLVAVHRDALEPSRRLKPEIPLTGVDGIPLRDEIELELIL
jgi:RimJ/RimL family protein N-acetyltransferase